MDPHYIPTSKLAEMKAVSPLDGDNKYTASDIRKMI